MGNPPFIGGKNIRGALNRDHPGYAEALWRAGPGVPPSADFVMQWWDRAASILTTPGTRLRRFGLVTTNSITQVFSRKVIEQYLVPADAAEDAAAGKLHLLMAIPDHPWTRVGKDAAAVRIAMTVAAAGMGVGRLVTITSEAGLNTDAPILREDIGYGELRGNLSLEKEGTLAEALMSNKGLSSRGVALYGAGFIVSATEAHALGLGQIAELDRYILPYQNGRDMLQRNRDKLVIDLHGLSEKQVRQQFPAVYHHLLKTVKPERDKNRELYRRTNWWLFGRCDADLRGFLTGLPQYIATVETAKHRIFQMLNAAIRPDNKLVAIGLSD